MIVTISYRNGTSEQFTGVTEFSIVGDVVTVVGTDAGGVSGTYILHWSDIQKVVKQP